MVDFGIAGLFAGHKSEVTHAGSLNYMPPELFTQKNVVASPALDVWSLGCILYALVVGKIPFRGDSVPDIRQKIVCEPYALPPGLTLSEELVDLLARLLEKDPESRASVYEIGEHAWVGRRKFTDDERARAKERSEQAAMLGAQLEKERETESPPCKKSKEVGTMKKGFTPSPDRARAPYSGPTPAKGISKTSPKEPVINLKESSKESPRKRSVHKKA